MADLQIIFMDAGQGDCTLIVYPDGSLTLVDCGSTKGGSGKDGAFAQIVGVLKRFSPPTGIQNLVITHPDIDHYNKIRYLEADGFFAHLQQAYYGGAIELYKNGTEKDWTYEYLKKLGASACAPVVDFAPDAKLSRAGVNVTVLAVNATGLPGHKPYKNENSIVLLVEYGHLQFFLMGDATKFTEDWIRKQLTKKGMIGGIQNPDDGSRQVLLKVGHHGSETSSGDPWLGTLIPNLLVVSSGTRIFKGKGIPTRAHLAHIESKSKLNASPIKDKTSYVVFDEAKKGVVDKEFVAIETKKTLWATCFDAKYIHETKRWFESGQTWYYGAGNTGLDRWYGWTGYEDAADASDDD